MASNADGAIKKHLRPGHGVRSQRKHHPKSPELQAKRVNPVIHGHRLPNRKHWSKLTGTNHTLAFIRLKGTTF